MVMYNEVKRLKIPVLMNTKMTKIYRNEDGIVVGVRGEERKAGKVLDHQGAPRRRRLRRHLDRQRRR